jgi:ketosteroid isomerase-like protein
MLPLLCCALAACAAPGDKPRAATAREQVIATERAFAKTMADRDLRAFGSFLSDETVFFSGPKPLRGRQAVIDFWSRFYAAPQAPFSWAPEEVEVLDSGTLALSSGPVHDAKGKLIGRFSSIWRLEAPGQWRIIFDKGSEVCDCEKK